MKHAKEHHPDKGGDAEKVAQKHNPFSFCHLFLNSSRNIKVLMKFLVTQKRGRFMINMEWMELKMVVAAVAMV
jgi:hypothetical protein